MKPIQITVVGVFILFAFINKSQGLGISDFENIRLGMTYNEVVSTFQEAGEFDYIINADTGQIIGDVVMKWGGGMTMGPDGRGRTQLGYIIIRFTDIKNNDPKSGKVAAFICCGLSNDPRCTCEKGFKRVYKDQMKNDPEAKQTKRINTRPNN